MEMAPPGKEIWPPSAPTLQGSNIQRVRQNDRTKEEKNWWTQII